MTWPFERLDNVAELCLGKMLDRQKNRGTLHPYLRNINVRWGTFDLSDIQEMPFEEHELERYSVRAGDVVICEGGEPGRCAVWTSSAPFFIQKALHRVRCSSKLSPEFLSYWMRYLAVSGRLARHFTGSTIHHLPGVALAALAVPCPPVGKQTQVVAAIDTHFSRVEVVESTLKRAKANVKRARASVLKAAVEGRLVPTESALARAEGRDYEPASTLLDRILTERRARWDENGGKGKYKDPAAPEAKPGELPKGWVWATLDTVAVRIESGSGATAISEPTTRRVLRSSAVRQGAIDWSDYRFLPEWAPSFSNDDIKVGDLLFTRLSGSLAYVGNCALVRSVPGKFEFPDRIFRATLVPSICGLFVQHCFEVPHLRASLEASAKSTAGHQRISLSDLRTFMIPLPPLAEQYRIAAEVDRRLSVLDALDATLDANLARCAKLRQSILKRAFEGKLVRPDAPVPDAPQLPLFTEEAAS